MFFECFRVRIGVGKLQHFGECKYVFQLDFARNTEFLLHSARNVDELRDGCFVVGNGNVSAGAYAERHAKDDRAADQLVLNLILETILKVGQVLGQLTRDVQKAVVHAADFNYAACALVHGLALSKPRHR